VCSSDLVLQAGLHKPSRLTLRIVGPDGRVVLRGRLSRPLDTR